MSAKNQRTLFISAFIIIALTIVGLTLLNFAIEKISQISPTIAMTESPKSTDDILGGAKKVRDNSNNPSLDMFNTGMQKGFNSGPHPPGLMQHRPPMPPPDMQKKLRNGRDMPDLRRAKPPSPPNNDPKNQNPPMRDMRDRNMMPPPMPDITKMSPAERDQFEREMERRQNQFFGSPDQFPQGFPPQGYYPPPPGYDGPRGYDGGYDDFYEGGYDDFYDGDLEGMRMEPKPVRKDVKLSDYVEDSMEDGEEDPDYGLEDEYLMDEMD